jgi:hypothetical protein
MKDLQQSREIMRLPGLNFFRNDRDIPMENRGVNDIVFRL